MPVCLSFLPSPGLVSKSSPKKPRGRSIFKALLCCFHTQHVGQSSSSSELTHKEEANTIAKVAGWGAVHILVWSGNMKITGPQALNSTHLVVCLLGDGCPDTADSRKGALQMWKVDPILIVDSGGVVAHISGGEACISLSRVQNCLLSRKAACSE